MEGTKYDTSKSRCDLLSAIAMQATAQVLTHGAAKYGDHNWRRGFKWSRLLASTFRHLFAYMCREDVDPESGLPHIDHVATNVMFLQEFYRTRKDLDDRHNGSNQTKEQ